MQFLYNLALLLFALLNLPKLIWERIRYGKYRTAFLEKLGFKLPTFLLPSQGLRIWVHSVSVGETKAAAVLVKKIRDNIPDAQIVISTTTETGLAEARRSMPGLSHYFLLPLDFSWTIRRLVNRICPDLLILVESDFWLNLVTHVKPVVLVNGKISETSLTRFLLFPSFTKRLFGAIDHFCVQSDRFAKRFEALGVDPQKITVTGNLKLDQPTSHIDVESLRKELGISSHDRVIVIGSTHEMEEERLMEALKPLWDHFSTLKIILVPRHPERFSKVASELAKNGIDFARFSEPVKKPAKVILVDRMGVLTACYQIAEIAIVGGSFVPGVGGHNIFEPAALGVPVLFGPYMESQKDLVDLVVGGKAGQSVTLAEIGAVIEKILKTPSQEMRAAGLQLAEQVHGATPRTYDVIKTFLYSKKI